MGAEEAWALEEQFWLAGADFFETRLCSGCVMAFPGVGLMTSDLVLKSLKEAARWSTVVMGERAMSRCGRSAIVLGYQADARREDGDPYRAWCTSTYAVDEGSWKLLQHQQTMVD